MLIKLENGSIYDPEQNYYGDIGHLFVQDGTIIADPGLDARFDAVYDLTGKVVVPMPSNLTYGSLHWMILCRIMA